MYRAAIKKLYKWKEKERRLINLPLYAVEEIRKCVKSNTPCE